MKENLTNQNLKYLEKSLGKEYIESYKKAIDENVPAEEMSDEDWEQFNVIDIKLEIIERYPNNQWWLSDNTNIITYYQLGHGPLLVPFSKFKESVAILFGKPVSEYEMSRMEIIPKAYMALIQKIQINR